MAANWAGVFVENASRAKVWVRLKPTTNFASMLEMLPDGKTIQIHLDRDTTKGHVNNQVVDWSFKVDSVLHNCSQEVVYCAVASDVVKAALDGYNGTIMAYGQTGAGKTFTMTGATETYNHRGIIPRSLPEIFREVEERRDQAISIRISFLEIYNEAMFDLLSPLSKTFGGGGIGGEGGGGGGGGGGGLGEGARGGRGGGGGSATALTIVEDEQGVYVKGLQSFLVNNEEEALNLLFESVGKTKDEAMYINKSLSFLEQAIVSLAAKQRSTFTPFRQSRLTHFLKDSIGGPCYTRLIANVWGEAAQLEETISTLRFATRMMCVPVEPAVNTRYNPTIMLKNLEREMCQLKKELAMHDILSNRSQVSYGPLSEQQRLEIRDTVDKYINNQINQIDIVNLTQVQEVFEAFRQCALQIAKETEADIKARYTLHEKTSIEPMSLPPSVVAASERRRSVLTQVGEMDSEVGVSLAAAGESRKIAQSSEVLAGKKVKAKISLTNKDSKDRKSMLLSGSGPPTRLVAFEEFKQDVGREINRILIENKDILENKKNSYKQLAKQINGTKEEIDKSIATVAIFSQRRACDGVELNQDGDIVISEEEYVEITRLKNLKATYRANFEELKTIKSQVQYCQNLVDQCRQRLIQEFDRWYADCFLSNASDASTRENNADHRQFITDTVYLNTGDAGCSCIEPAVNNDPKAATYNQVKSNVQRRKIYQKAEQQLNTSDIHQPAIKKVPGAPIRSLRKAPPCRLDVQ